MQVKTVKYGAKAPTYDYAHQTIEIEIEIKEGEDYQEGLSHLKQKVHELLKSREDIEEWEAVYDQCRNTMKIMQKHYQEACKEYETLVTFCQANGIKKDFPDFPQLSHIQNFLAGYLKSPRGGK